MTRRQSLFLTVNVLGGMAVLGSYAWGIGTHSGNAQALWGGIEGRMRIVYTANMLPATLGYLFMFAFALKHLNAARHWRSLIAWNAAFLAASSLWMPLTFAAIDGANPDLLGWIQGVLAVAGVGSIAMWVQVARIAPGKPSPFKVPALCTGAFLVIQCAILDAIIWPRYFSL